MSLEHSGGLRAATPNSSGRSSPIPRALRRTAGDSSSNTDKAIRRYATLLERVLASWEVSPQEWADYIAFLGRLLKALQTHPPELQVLPHSVAIASKLAQCLDPSLPSGVHQKALEVYTFVFSTFGDGYIANHLHQFLPGLSAVLAFASLSVRPAIYGLFEEHIVTLPADELRPALKALILSLLPALEDETSEDFERAFNILEVLENRFTATRSDDDSEHRGYFWQCLFLAVITSPSRRQGALSYLTRKLPTFGPSSGLHSQAESSPALDIPSLLPEAEAVVLPEPGLLVRCFVCGLSDSQILIQRGFLDLLVTHLPLNSPVLQRPAGQRDLERLVTAAAHVLLRRDMSLNRRLWSWFLGPDTGEATREGRPELPDQAPLQQNDAHANRPFVYFSNHGRQALERSVLDMFERADTKAADRAQPFRICLSLMDRGEIGGTIIPSIFLPAIKSVHSYERGSSSHDLNEVLRSASLFFDGIEAHLIWSNLITLLEPEDKSEETRAENLRLFAWIIGHFNVTDEEMLVVHLPYASLYLLATLGSSTGSPESSRRINHSLDLLSTILALIPPRAFATSDSGMAGSRQQIDESVSSIIRTYYTDGPQETADTLPLTGQSALHLLASFLEKLIQRLLHENASDAFSKAMSLLIPLMSKNASQLLPQVTQVYDAVVSKCCAARTSSQGLSFPALSAIVSFAAAMLGPGAESSTADLAVLEPELTAQIWRYLSPSTPKFHVEAVRLLWQLESFKGASEYLEASITGLTIQAPNCRAKQSYAEAAQCFCVLWSHTIPASASSIRSGSLGGSRRGSAMSALADPKQLKHRESILSRSLMLLIDALERPYDEDFEVVRIWLLGMPSLDRVLRLHLDLLPAAMSKFGGLSLPTASAHRQALEGVRELEFILAHLSNILLYGNDTILHCLEDVIYPASDAPTKTGLTVLAECCNRVLGNELASRSLSRVAMEILQRLLSGPSATALQGLGLDTDMLDLLNGRLVQGEVPIQGQFLRLLTLALQARLLGEPTMQPPTSRRRSSHSSKRLSGAGNRQSPSTSATALVASPPPQLMSCLRRGFSAPNARPHLDQWLDFLSTVLPIFSDSLFSSLIPLVECLCEELNKSHQQLVALAKKGEPPIRASPESEAMTLLEALEMVISHAHDSLDKDAATEPAPKQTPASQTILGNVTAGVFKTEANPSRTAQANSRLTVILACQDAIRISLKIYTWASHSTDTEDFDKYSAATTSFNALRLRNRTRHMLEEIFAAEPLESLEVIITHWCHTKDAASASAAVDLLHVMQASRPKDVIPAMLDALCSRANPAVLPSHRQSSQTTDLSSLDIALFLAAYIDSIEDDAMDEVWSDCVAFWKDVLGNPLPYRAVLPALLSTIHRVAQKTENTNFGDQRKLRRELGDIFQRLMAATFTAIPSGYAVDSADGNGTAAATGNTNSARGAKTMGLISVLVRVVSDIEAILETSDRAATAVNSISSNLVAPLFHAKTFPRNIAADTLELVLQMAKKCPAAKPWKKDVSDVFNDSRFLASPADLVQKHWFPVLRQWSLYDKERMSELISRLAPPSSAGIMFGVGANAARMDADKKTQLNLRRICLLLLASPEDTYAEHLRALSEKIVELSEASPSSSPSSAVMAEVFMLCRAIALSSSPDQAVFMWPVVNDNLQSALTSMLPAAPNSAGFGNLTLLQACKLLDLLIAVSPDDFQLHEWLYISDTIDAVYQPADWSPSALADQIADALTADTSDDAGALSAPESQLTSGITAGATPGRRRRPLFFARGDGDGDEESTAAAGDKEDWKAMARDDFARALLRPFLSQISIYAYEGVYSMDVPDAALCRRGLLEDLLDLSTVVE